MSQLNYSSPPVGIETNVITPTDRVRWGPIIAGLFAALSVMLMLTLLGLAVGLSSVDADDRASSFGIGAGIWGGVTALVAFFFGGWVAARMAATRGGNNGAWQGAMVWMVAIPVLLYMLAGGIGALLSTAGKVTETAVNASSNVAGGVAAGAGNASENVDRAQVASMAQEATASTQQAGDAVRDQVASVRQSVTPQKVEEVAGKAARGAWGTLISMTLALGAATVGGFLGVRDRVIVPATR